MNIYILMDSAYIYDEIWLRVTLCCVKYGGCRRCPRFFALFGGLLTGESKGSLVFSLVAGRVQRLCHQTFWDPMKSMKDEQS